MSVHRSPAPYLLRKQSCECRADEVVHRLDKCIIRVHEVPLFYVTGLTLFLLHEDVIRDAAPERQVPGRVQWKKQAERMRLLTWRCLVAVEFSVPSTQ